MILRRSFLTVVSAIFFSAAQAQIVSDFAANADGWTTPNDADAAITYSATGGNPNGYVFGTPFFFVGGSGTTYFPFYFVAPAKFRGNRSAYYNGTLRYEVQQSTTGAGVQYPEVSIADNTGINLYYFPATPNQPPAAPTWQQYSVVLNNSLGFWKTDDSQTAPTATEAQLQAVLADLADLQIRGMYRNANVQGRLDNVTLYPPIIINTQPGAANVCSGGTRTFTTAATNNAAITYRWQYEFSPSVFSDISDGGGYSGALTSTLTVNTTGNFGAGNYRCRVSGQNVVDAFTSPATLTVQALPPAPTTTGSARCGPGPLSVSASGGLNGQYRWYTVAAGGTAIIGETNSTYATPNLLATVTYHVSINNGICEGPRSAVTATINSEPAAPTATGNSSCTAASITLTAAGGTNGQYRWYSVLTGGTAIAGQVNSTFATPVVSATTTYYVSINNGSCESPRTAVAATIGGAGCSNTPPVIITEPASTQIGGTIVIDLSDLISDADNNLDLSTLSIVTPPGSGAVATISNNILTINYNGVSFTGSETITLRVCDVFAACTQQTFAIVVDGSLKVFNALSPTRNGKNDVFFIQNIDKLTDTQKNHVAIFNRWGDLVWEGNNYNNTTVAFTGKSKNDADLPAGTYYYTIEYTRAGKKQTLTGFIALKR